MIAAGVGAAVKWFGSKRQVLKYRNAWFKMGYVILYPELVKKLAAEWAAYANRVSVKPFPETREK